MLSFFTAILLSQQSDLDKAAKEAEADRKKDPIASTQVGPATVSLLDFSLDGVFAVGASNQEDDQLSALQGGGHDPNKRGFTVQNVELAAAAAVDPYFTAQANLIWFIDAEGETVVEIEEGYGLTSSLPYGLQIRAGTFFTEFGRHNTLHPHSWDFQDQPVIATRFFGPDGMRGPGVRTSWLMPLPFYSELMAGAQNATGETMVSFRANDEVFDPLEGAPIGGRQFFERETHSLKDFVYLLRWATSLDMSDEITAVGGISGLFGANATGPEAMTRIYGVDLRVKWRPTTNFRGWPFILWQTEFMMREYETDDQNFDPDGTPASGDEFTVDDTLIDRGFYTYLLWGFTHGWAAGIRFERAMGSEDSVVYDDTGAPAGLSDEDDPFRDGRTRLSLLLSWHPTEFTRIRLQYNYDKADHLDALKDADEIDDEVGHTLWLGFEFMFGTHAAHTY